MYIRIATLLILITSLIGCDFLPPIPLDDPPEQPSHPLAGEWFMESIDGTSLQQIVESTPITSFLVVWAFDDDGAWRVTQTITSTEFGSVTVPVIGSYTINNDTITLTYEGLTDEGLTEIAGIPFIGTRQFSWTLEEHTLALTSDEGMVIILTR